MNNYLHWIFPCEENGFIGWAPDMATYRWMMLYMFEPVSKVNV